MIIYPLFPVLYEVIFVIVMTIYNTVFMFTKYRCLFYRIILFVLISLSVSVSFAQLPVNIDQLSDQQLQQYLNQAQLSGLSEAQLEVKAREKGLSDDQINKLKARVAGLQKSTGSFSINSSGMGNDSDRVPVKTIIPDNSNQNQQSKIFGVELFSNQNLTFDPNMKIATPRNYVLGIGDQLHIDVFGYSETNFSLKVTPEGFIRIPNIGPVKVAGLTIEDAEKKIKGLLVKIYPQIATGQTSLQVSLGQIRSIRVTLIGEARKPGTYTISSLATIANALYVSGGPGDNGSFRDIELVRNGKTISTFDLYDFLLKGDLSKNLLLQDDDIIKLNPYKIRVELQGAVKRTAIFEVKGGENLKEVIGRFAGGFADNAYTNNIKLVRMGAMEKEIINVPFAGLSSFTMHSGDVYSIDSITNRFANRVSITGAVFHPGDYSVNDFPSLKLLVNKAGLKEDAFMQRAVIRRLQEDYTPQTISFNVRDIIRGNNDIQLQREDEVTIYSVFDVKERYTISINGEVNKPGTYEYADSIKLQDLILVAGGFRYGASAKKIEIARRIRTNGPTERDTATYAVVKNFELNNTLESQKDIPDFTLLPYDIISVRKSPAYNEQVKVTIEGEVLYPGDYVITRKEEKLSDLVKRAGGFKEGAYPIGAVLIRSKESVSKTRFIDQERKNLLASSDSSLNRDSLVTSINDNIGSVGIKLEKAVNNPNSKYDIYLEEGDILSVPKKLQTVKTWGGVYIPKQIVFSRGMHFKDYVGESGGFTTNAVKRKTIVIYANGEVARTKGFLWFRRYPTVEPGSEVYVPIKKRNKSAIAEIGAVGATLASLASVLVTIIYISRL